MPRTGITRARETAMAMASSLIDQVGADWNEVPSTMTEMGIDQFLYELLKLDLGEKTVVELAFEFDIVDAAGEMT